MAKFNGSSLLPVVKTHENKHVGKIDRTSGFLLGINIFKSAETILGRLMPLDPRHSILFNISTYLPCSIRQVKPLDEEAVIANAKECGGRIVTVEDHYPEV